MALVLVVDNYDSFVYNLVQYVGLLGAAPLVVRPEQLEGIIDRTGGRPGDPGGQADLDGVLLSPGPGRPENATASMRAIEVFAGKVPLLGVCLGYQCIAAAFGATVGRGDVMHGKASEISHDGHGIFHDLPNPLLVGRYHSLAVSPGSVPDCLTVSAETDEGAVMGLRHRELAIEAVQFHPESVLTRGGLKLVANWLEQCGQEGATQLAGRSAPEEERKEAH